jgi:phosphoribosyl 1,2-cyclic phosphodiesterase
MEQLRHAGYHPTIKGKYSYVIEYKERIPSKRSFNSAEECAELALQIAESKYKEKLINIHILMDDKHIESLK